MGALAIDSAANRLGSSEDLLDGASHGACHRSAAESLGNVVDVIVRDVAVVLDWGKNDEEDAGDITNCSSPSCGRGDAP